MTAAPDEADVPVRPARRTLGRASWNLLDQVLSSGTNAALSFLVARSVDATEFGGLAVALSVFAILVGLTRALATSPLGVRFSDAPTAAFRTAASSASGAALAISLVAGAGCLAASTVVGPPTASTLLTLGVVFPGLLVQDACRQVFFAAARPAAAAANDAVWAVAQIGLIAVLLHSGVSTVWPLVAAWGGSAVLAALVGLLQARMVPRPQLAARWVSRHRDLTGYLVGQFLALQGSQQGALLVIAGLASLDAIGALRGVQVLLGPTTILAVAAVSFAVPEFSRRRSRLDVRGWLTSALCVSAVVGVLGLAWGVLFIVLPGSVGASLLGQTWPGVQSILVPTILGQLAATIGLGPSAMLVAMDRTRRTFLLSMLQSPLILVGGIGGALLHGALGAAWGFALVFWVMAPVNWIVLGREARRRPTLESGTPPVDAPAG